MSGYRAVRTLLFALPAESAHGLAHSVLRGIQSTPLERMLQSRFSVDDERLTVHCFGCEFPNPVGVAAGFDKNGEIPAALASLGFGHVEIGGVTAEPQAGNPRPRLFRLVEDRALINRMGFNNDGADAIAERLSAGPHPGVPLGINIGKSKSVPLEDAPEDYRYTAERMAPVGDFFVVNVSSPNTPGLRSLQDRDHLETILETVSAAGARPLLVKLSPDLAEPAVAEAVEVAEAVDLDGIIATNTTITRPNGLRSPHRAETGGLSGQPLEETATAMIRTVASQTDIPIVGVGGVFTAEDAYRKIRAGATLVQLYTGLIYRGPGIARSINRGLGRLLERDGYDSIADAVGADIDR